MSRVNFCQPNLAFGTYACEFIFYCNTEIVTKFEPYL